MKSPASHSRPTRDLRQPGGASLPTVRITRASHDEVIVVIPRWNAATCAMAHRIAATLVEELGSGNWPWVDPVIERGRLDFSTVVRAKIAPSARHEQVVDVVVRTLEHAAERESYLKVTSHRVGIQTHAVEVTK